MLPDAKRYLMEYFKSGGGEYLSYSKNESSDHSSFYHRFCHEDFFSDSEEELLKASR